MLKKREPARSFLDLSNTYLKGVPVSTPSELHSLLRRKSERLLDVVKNEDKFKENQADHPKICLLPPSRVQRSGSEVFSRMPDPKDAKEL